MNGDTEDFVQPPGLDVAAHGRQDFTGEVLIVEDTPASVALLSDLMLSAGYSVRHAQDGEMALLTAAARTPDLILLDVRMPRMDGFEVCRRLKADPATADIPVIFLSALQDTDAKVQGFQLGAVDYIGKPYQIEEVLLRVRTHLELRSLQLRLGEMCDMRTRQLKEEIAERRHAERELLESRQKLRELTGYLEDVREAERSRIAREIHDELGQVLTVARIDLTRLAARLDEPRPQLEATIAGVIDILDGAANTARGISEDLRPGMLDMLGLGAAIEHHVMRFSQTTGIPCDLDIQDRGRLDADGKVATAAFRIVQEALTNVARHAAATHVRIDIVDGAEEIGVSVMDNGKGMAEAQAGTGRRSFGLLGMTERAQLLGGRLAIESSPGKGTRIMASLPHGETEGEA